MIFIYHKVLQLLNILNRFFLIVIEFSTFLVFFFNKYSRWKIWIGEYQINDLSIFSFLYVFNLFFYLRIRERYMRNTFRRISYYVIRIFFWSNIRYRRKTIKQSKNEILHIINDRHSNALITIATFNKTSNARCYNSLDPRLNPI